MQTKLSVDQWHRLAEDKKEIVRTWAVTHDLELEIIPSITASTCDYAALLTTEQLKLFLNQLNENAGKTLGYIPDDCSVLWAEIIRLL